MPWEYPETPTDEAYTLLCIPTQFIPIIGELFNYARIRRLWKSEQDHKQGKQFFIGLQRDLVQNMKCFQILEDIGVLLAHSSGLMGTLSTPLPPDQLTGVLPALAPRLQALHADIDPVDEFDILRARIGRYATGKNLLDLRGAAPESWPGGLNYISLYDLYKTTASSSQPVVTVTNDQGDEEQKNLWDWFREVVDTAGDVADIGDAVGDVIDIFLSGTDIAADAAGDVLLGSIGGLHLLATLIQTQVMLDVLLKTGQTRRNTEEILATMGADNVLGDYVKPADSILQALRGTNPPKQSDIYALIASLLVETQDLTSETDVDGKLGLWELQDKLEGIRVATATLELRLNELMSATEIPGIVNLLDLQDRTEQVEAVLQAISSTTDEIDSRFRLLMMQETGSDPDRPGVYGILELYNRLTNIQLGTDDLRTEMQRLLSESDQPGVIGLWELNDLLSKIRTELFEQGVTQGQIYSRLGAIISETDEAGALGLYEVIQELRSLDLSGATVTVDNSDVLAELQEISSRVLDTKTLLHQDVITNTSVVGQVRTAVEDVGDEVIAFRNLVAGIDFCCGDGEYIDPDGNTTTPKPSDYCQRLQWMMFNIAGFLLDMNALPVATAAAVKDLYKKWLEVGLTQDTITSLIVAHAAWQAAKEAGAASGIVPLPADEGLTAICVMFAAETAEMARNNYLTAIDGFVQLHPTMYELHALALPNQTMNLLWDTSGPDTIPASIGDLAFFDATFCDGCTPCAGGSPVASEAVYTWLQNGFIGAGWNEYRHVATFGSGSNAADHPTSTDENRRASRDGTQTIDSNAPYVFADRSAYSSNARVRYCTAGVDVQLQYSDGSTITNVDLEPGEWETIPAAAIWFAVMVLSAPYDTPFEYEFEGLLS